MQATGGDAVEKSREKIIFLLNENGHHTTRNLAESLGLTTKAIEEQLARLKAEGLIVRIGSDKGGHWEVV